MKTVFFSIVLLLGSLAISTADDGPWYLVPEPQFMRHDVAWPIPGAEQTVLVPARTIDGEVTLLKRADIPNLETSREEIMASAVKNASTELAKIKPQYVRDRNGSIQYAIIASESPYTASTVFAPEFNELFEETLGPDILVVIPNRNKIIVFPRAAPQLGAASDLVFAEFRSSTYPVSREIFALKNGRLAAVGVMQ